MPKNKPRRASRSGGASLLLYTSAFLVLIAFGLALALSTPGEGPFADRADEALLRTPEPVAAAPRESSPPAASPTGGAATVDEGPAIAPARPGKEKMPAVKSRGVLVFVIDDAGHNIRQLEPFLAFPGPLTIAVLPGLPYTSRAAAMVSAAGKELILHQPMEALAGLDPGPGAIGSEMDDATIRRVVRDNIAQVPGAVGINNHMGSKATSDVRVMSTVLGEAAASGLYFLDSLTVNDSVVHSVASLMRQSAWERSVFLDNTPDKASILHYVAEGTKIAEKRGYAVMIGHVWSAGLAQTLADLYPQLMEQGFSLSTISRIMMDSDDDDDLGD
ncbi:MAG: divergent polysaccharide deacetylase family protein [Spirochaetes bacterium]|nr:divergent polysaccharide deacetylase family protein [Spirochaetota bacterium]MBU1080346.1 divergent polysaccharide deacetylase family protein [Spirochaetota bacterium]